MNPLNPSLISDKLLISSQGYTSLLADLNLKLINPNLSTKKASINQVVPQEFKVDSTATTTPQIACIYVNGILVKGASPEQEEELGLSNTDFVAQALDEANEDPTVSEICLIFNSPGGKVTGIEELGRKIANSAKPVKGWTETKACSGAYWLISQCSVIGCSPSAQIGSIGVMLVLDDLSKALETAGIKKEAFHGGEFKLIGQPFKSITDAERTFLQTGVDETHEQFKQAVLAKRQVDPSYLEGLVYEGKQAKAGNLVDIVTDTLDQFLTTNNYKVTKDMNKVTKINKPVEMQALASDKKEDVAGVPGTKEADTANGRPANPVHYTTPNHKVEGKEDGKEAESGHYGGGYIACPACKLQFKMEARHMIAGPDEGKEEPADKPEDKPTPKPESEIEEDKEDVQKTEKPNEKMEDEKDEKEEKEAKAPSFNDWRAQALGFKPKQASAFHTALNDYITKGGTKLS